MSGTIQPEQLPGGVTLYCGDNLSVLPSLGQVDAVVTDPPYELGFMGKAWDKNGVAFDPATWDKVLRVVKPGGYMAALGGTRTYHRMTCAIEDAGFEIRDCLMWLYGTGFPKGKGCLKPAVEPIVLARRPGPKVLPLGIDECRIPTSGNERLSGGAVSTRTDGWDRPWKSDAEAVAACKARSAEAVAKAESLGRWPANVLHDGSDEVLEAFAKFGESRSSGKRAAGGRRGSDNTFAQDAYTQEYQRTEWSGPADSGTADRFFYCAKASKSERGDGNSHPTVKPLALMQWLVRLVCPPGGRVLDPFAGSGTTGKACREEGRECVLIEREPAYCDIIRTRFRVEQPTVVQHTPSLFD